MSLVWVWEYFRVLWGLTTARSYANVLSPQDPEAFIDLKNTRPRGIYKVLEDLKNTRLRGIYKHSEAFIRHRGILNRLPN